MVSLAEWLQQPQSQGNLCFVPIRCMPFLASGRASFLGGVYTVHKWTKNTRTKLGNMYQLTEIEKRIAHFKSTFTTGFIKWSSKNKIIIISMPPVVIHVGSYLRVKKVPLFANAVRIPSMILHTARFSCIICTEICIDMTHVWLRITDKLFLLILDYNKVRHLLMVQDSMVFYGTLPWIIWSFVVSFTFSVLVFTFRFSLLAGLSWG